METKIKANKATNGERKSQSCDNAAKAKPANLRQFLGRRLLPPVNWDK